MSISREDVERLARLSRLALDEDEVAAMVRDLGAILDYVATLGNADLEGIDPADVVPERGTPLRDDVVRPSLAEGEATREAPGAHHDLFRVPPVLGSEP